MRLIGIPAVRYWEREGLSPARAWSNSFAASSRASGGRVEGSFVCGVEVEGSGSGIGMGILCF